MNISARERRAMDEKPDQTRFTMYAGAGEIGRARLARWLKAAHETHKMDGALLEWMRLVCDAAADRILAKTK